MKFLAAILSSLMFIACGGGGGNSATTVASQNYSVTKDGAVISDPASNVRISIPSGTTTTPFTLSIVKAEASSTTVEMVTGANLVVAGNQYSIDTDLSTDWVKSAIVTMPFNKTIAADPSKVGVAYFSPSINKYVPVELLSVDEVNGTVSFETNHFSFWVPIIGLTSFSSEMLLTETDFNPMIDGFPFSNNLSSPYNFVRGKLNQTVLGNCIGMSTLSVGYYRYYRAANKVMNGLSSSLNGATNNCDASLSNKLICEGINIASNELNSVWDTIFASLSIGDFYLPMPIDDAGSAKSIYLALTQYGKTPALLFITDKRGNNGHAVVVYRYVPGVGGTGTFYYYDPNLPNDLSPHFFHKVDGSIDAFYYGGGTAYLAGKLKASPFVGGGMTPDRIKQIIDQYFPHSSPLAGC